jgi:exodeoxyribonuclease-3
MSVFQQPDKILLRGRARRAIFERPSRKGEMKTFKIATYNVNSVRSRLHIVIPWLEKNRPGVLCLQETKVENEKFPLEAFRNTGYHVVFSGGKSYNGVAVASLEAPEDVFCGFDDGGPADPDRLIRGVFSGIPVVNAYVPQGRDRETPPFQYKLQWYGRLTDMMKKYYSRERPLICCGDLNVAREDIDVHDPKRLLGHVDFTPEVWGAFDRLKNWGFEDVFRKHHGAEGGHYTFYDYRVPKSVERGLGWRVDHILATPVLASRSVRCFIDMEPRLAEKPSDHTILMAEFRI